MTTASGAQLLPDCADALLGDSLGADQINGTLAALSILREAAAAMGLRVFGGVNAPYIWVSTPSGMTSWQMFDRMLGEANVVITPGSGFGAMGEGYFRISAFNSRANVEEVARRMKAITW